MIGTLKNLGLLLEPDRYIPDIGKNSDFTRYSMAPGGTLDPSVVAIFRGLVDPQYPERDQALGIEFMKIQTAMVKAGQFGGSAGVAMAIRAAKAELQERGSLAKQMLLNVVDAAGLALDDAFSAVLGSVIDVELEQQAAHLKARTLNHGLCKGTAANSAAPLNIGEIDNEVARLSQLYRAQFNLMVLKSQNHPMQNNNPIINVAGSVGVLQAGANSSVVGNQQFGQAEIASLAAALQILLLEVRSLPDTALTLPKGDVIDAVQATIQEAEKPKPNRLTLKGMLGSLRDTLSTVGQLRGAVDGVDAAARFISNL